MTSEIKNTETPSQLSHSTLDGTPTNFELEVEQTATPGFWQRRIPIPYNQAHWKKYELRDGLDQSDNTIYSIMIVSDQKAWIGTASGLWKYENNQFEHFTSQENLFFTYRSKIKIAPDGKLWLSYGYRVNRISSWDEKEDWQDYSFPGYVIDFAISKAGVVWVAYTSSDTSQAGVSFYQNHAWHPVQIGDGSQKSNTIRSMFASSDGSVWFDTEAYNIMFRFKENQWTQYVREIQQSVIDEEWSPVNFSYMTEGLDGTLWGATGNKIYHYTGQSWESYYGSHQDGMGLGAVAISKDGKIWAGDGFIKDGKNYYFTNLPFYQLYAIQVAPNGSVWYGSNRGLFIYDNLE
jgi:ligand-binding sensor domain-containing protein